MTDDELRRLPDGSLTREEVNELLDRIAAEPPALDVFAACPVCGRIEQVEMRDGWQAAVDAGATIPIIGCGNPWHYASLAREASDGA